MAIYLNNLESELRSKLKAEARYLKNLSEDLELYSDMKDNEFKLSN